MDLQSIMTFDKRILNVGHGMSADEQVFAEGAFRSGWILGIDESDQLMYFEPTSGETHSVTLDGDQVMRSTTDHGSGVAPGAAPLPTTPLPTTPLPTLAAAARMQPAPAAALATPAAAQQPAAQPAAQPAVPALPPAGPVQIAAGIWQLPENAVQIAPGIFQIQ